MEYLQPWNADAPKEKFVYTIIQYNSRSVFPPIHGGMRPVGMQVAVLPRKYSFRQAKILNTVDSIMSFRLLSRSQSINRHMPKPFWSQLNAIPVECYIAALPTTTEAIQQ